MTNSAPADPPVIAVQKGLDEPKYGAALASLHGEFARVLSSDDVLARLPAGESE